LTTPFDEADFLPTDDETDFWSNDQACVGCDLFASVGDLGLCSTCATKLDRDMIRQRAWEYSISAFAVPPREREKLRSAILAKFGKALELIAPHATSPARHRR
jgi:hypothetical protein